MNSEDFNKLTPAERDVYFAEGAKAYREKKAAEARNNPKTYGASEYTQSSLYVPAYTKGLTTLTGAELLQRDFPPREMLLSPFLPQKGLAMVFAERGIGKTWVGLNVAHAVSGGGTFLKWAATRPCNVIYIDGEMPASVLKDRYAHIVATADFDAPEDNLRFMAADLQQDGLPDLADASAQHFYDDYIKDAELVIIDNLSTVCRSLRENEADSFGAVQAWLIRQRAAGKSVLIIHHAGKGGGQRGTSRKEDVLDSVISLRRPINYDASEGARFEVHFTKSRGFFGDDARPFEAQLVDSKWYVNDIVADDSDETIAQLHENGMSIRDIAERLGISKSAVDRKLKRGAV